MSASGLSARAPRATFAARGRVAGLVRRPELAALMLLAGVLDLWRLEQNGWANDYYSAAVRSMSSSWHDFLYASFDPAGIMTVDKPPLALWVQALSARIFGFHSLSLLVPQALMGVASVALVYDLTRRWWGRAGGFAAGLAMATTPIAVAIFRHNNPDALLVLCCTAALWFVVRGLADGRARWMALAGLCVGLGFETKMGAALLVVPGLAAAWVWAAPRRRVAGLLAGGATMAAAGAAWPVLVWLTPASDRPWVSGTSDNSIWSLILGYNGFGRLDGQAGGPGGTIGGGGGGPGGGVFGGPTGPFRLLETSLGGQAGWLLGAALAGLVGLAVVTRLRRRDPRSGWLIAAGGSLLVVAIAFSFAQGIFHPYYTAQLAPFVAAIVGATAGRAVTGDRAGRVVGAAAIAGGVITELVVLHQESTMPWLEPVLVVGGALAIAALLALASLRRVTAVLAVAGALLLAAPATWAFATLGHATSSTFPAGGPATSAFGGPGGRMRAGAPPAGFAPPSGGSFPGAGTFRPRGFAGGGGGMFGGDSQSVTAAVAYAKAHGGGTVVVAGQTGASSAIIDSGADVAGIGGFSGRESQVTVAWLAQEIRAGHIRWVLTEGSSAGPDGRVGASAVMSAVQKTCRSTSVSGLYDCSSRADALAAAG